LLVRSAFEGLMMIGDGATVNPSMDPVEMIKYCGMSETPGARCLSCQMAQRPPKTLETRWSVALAPVSPILVVSNEEAK
jgi:hypothetical protein